MAEKQPPADERPEVAVLARRQVPEVDVLLGREVEAMVTEQPFELDDRPQDLAPVVVLPAQGRLDPLLGRAVEAGGGLVVLGGLADVAPYRQ